MRINYSDDEDRPGQFALWQTNCARSLRGKAGQAALRTLETALIALPAKRLIAWQLVDDAGDVCAVGAYARHQGLDLSRFDPEDETDQVGVEAGMPRLVAWQLVELNDIVLNAIWGCDDDPKGRYRKMSPEERYDRVLAWVRAQLTSQE